MLNEDLQEYYKKRADEYESIYHRDDPIRQREQQLIIESMKQTLTGRNILEVASGTGYWTQFLSEVAESITATDIESKVLLLAKSKQYSCPISFEIQNAYQLSYDPASFNGAVANMWLSHVPRKKIDAFLMNLHRVLKLHSHIFICDNVYVPGIGGNLITKEGDENTYKERTLKDGSKHLILKNYYSVKQIVQIFRKHIPQFSTKNIFYGMCFWFLNYDLI
jgi:ubiquinone/menaquinone biosynthesis C-methylase UbiE